MHVQLLNIGTTLDAVQVVSFLVGPALPVIVGLVTRLSTHPKVKAVLLIVIAALAGFGTEFLANPSHFNVVAAILTWIGTWLVAVASYKGALKNFDWMKWIQANAGATEGSHALRSGS